MAIHDTARLDDFGGSARNYLYDWARRTGNVGNLSAFCVITQQDMTTGFVLGHICDAPAEVAEDASAVAPEVDAAGEEA